jgi:hypothetical protein
MIASAQIASSLPSVNDIRGGAFNSEGWSGEGQIRETARRTSITRRGSSQGEDFKRTETIPEQLRHESVPEVYEGADNPSTAAGSSSMAYKDTTIEMETLKETPKADQRSSSSSNLASKTPEEFRTTPFENGYQFPPKHSFGQSTVIGLKATWKFVTTPIGFLVTIYGLNVVAWGGMLFLLLCNASPAMCHPSCGDINSPRRVWIEIDSQILNALFCVTGFGTIPWRFRDLYYLMQYRIQKKELGLRRLAGINRGWFRLAGSQELPVSIGPNTSPEELAMFPESVLAFPLTKIANAPLTGTRAPPTAMWKLDFVIWTMVWNTFLQAVLSGFMWGLNRYNRPSWSTGLFVALACIVAACGGIMSFVEGKKVKAIEGVPISAEDQRKLEEDREKGIVHYNNIKDEKPKTAKEKKDKEEKLEKEKGLFHRHVKEAEDVAVDESAAQDASRQVVR